MSRPEKEDATDDINHASDGEFLVEEVPRGKVATLVHWSVAVALRVIIWYTILTALFRCPSNSTELDGFSPQVCGPYLNARSHIDPYVTPYYETYAAPYIEAVQPYAHNFHRNIYSPTKTFAVRQYRTYGAPRLEQGLNFFGERWTETVTPRLHATRNSLARSYSSSVKSHITKTRDIVVPRYQATAESLAHVRDNYFSPYYAQLEPGVSRTYAVIHDLISNKILPHGKKLCLVSVDFVNGTLRPWVARLYFENVEPQLIRIGNKLREGKRTPLMGDKVERPMNDTTGGVAGRENVEQTDADVTEDAVETSIETASESPSEIPSETISYSDTAPSPSSASQESIVADPSIHDSTVAYSGATDTPQAVPETESVAEKIANDLERWQDKFAIAADNGCEALEEQVVNIVKNLADSEFKGRGEEILGALEFAAQNQVELVKAKVVEIVKLLSEDPTSEELAAAQEQLLDALRTSGAAIREPAHALREWFNDYDGQLVGQVTAAVSSTLEVLDSIRDLGLQEIGMRWAWMDGVTYKDWEKFHALKAQLSEWRNEVSDIGMQHNALVTARNDANDVMSRGMVVTEGVAQELAKLKEVAQWKFEAGDDSDDFDWPTEDPKEFRANKKAALERELAEAARRAAEEASENEMKQGDVEDLHPASVDEVPKPASIDEQVVAGSEMADSSAIPIEVGSGSIASDVIVESVEREVPSTLEEAPDTTDSSENTASAVAEELEEADPNLQNRAEEVEQLTGSSENTPSVVAENLEEADPNLQNRAEEVEQLTGSSENTASVVVEELGEADPNLQSPADDLSSPQIEAILDSTREKLQAKLDVVYKEITDPRRQSQDSAASILNMAGADLEDLIATLENQLNIAIEASNEDAAPAADDMKLQGAMKRFKEMSNDARALLQQLSVRSQEYATLEAESIIQAAGTGAAGTE